MDFSDKEQLLSYLKNNRLWTKKSLGQNFLVDRKALDKIVEAAELSENDTVLEIGPGLGVLTEELVKRAGGVVAVEKDERLAELLESRIQNPELGRAVKILKGDVLELDPRKILRLAPLAQDDLKVGYKLVANIPYYITSKIIEKFLSDEQQPQLMVMLVQKEVAERICAKPGELSVLAISVQYYGVPEIVDIVPRDSFFPAPEVDSAIIRIRTRNQKPEIDDKEFFKVVKAGFRARRKTLFNNLKSGSHLNVGQIEVILDKMGLTKNTRAQELSVGQWEELVNIIKAMALIN